MIIRRLYVSSLVVLFLSFFFLNACSDSEVRKKVHFDKGVEYVQQRQFKEAILEFRNAIQLDPVFAQARYQLGLVYL